MEKIFHLVVIVLIASGVGYCLKLNQMKVMVAMKILNEPDTIDLIAHNSNNKVKRNMNCGVMEEEI